jgi:hypothetical protein
MRSGLGDCHAIRESHGHDGSLEIFHRQLQWSLSVLLMGDTIMVIGLIRCGFSLVLLDAHVGCHRTGNCIQPDLLSMGPDRLVMY